MHLHLYFFLHIGCYGLKAFQPSRPNCHLAKLREVMRKHDQQKDDGQDKDNENDKYI